MSRLLTINNLNKYYFNESNKIEAIKDISLTVDDNEIVAILGTSGCGKSSLLSIISGNLDYTSGTISKKDNLTFGYMLQNDTLFPWLNVKKNCLLGLEITHSINSKKEKELLSLLNKYNLSNFINAYPDALSGGMKQRVSLIRTILMNPDILLLDEPFSALDYKSRINIREDVYNLIKERKKSAIVVTHDIEEAITLADRIIILSSRPSYIIGEITIDHHGYNSIKFKSTSFYHEYYERVWKLLNEC